MESDLRSGLDAQGDESGRQLAYLGGEFAERDVDESVAVAIGEGGPIRVLLSQGEQGTYGVVVGLDRGQSGRVKFLHGGPPAPQHRTLRGVYPGRLVSVARRCSRASVMSA